MPEEIEEKIRESVRNAHPDYDEKRVNDEVFATMNKQGLLHKSKKYKHGRKGTKE
jgi:hypothetical protein